MSLADSGPFGSALIQIGVAGKPTPSTEAMIAGESASLPQLPPGDLSPPPPEAATGAAATAVESEDKLRAIAQFKAAIQQSLQKKIPQPHTEALLSLCLCLQRRGLEDSVCKDLGKLLSKSAGDNVLVPLMGVKRKQVATFPAQCADADIKKYVGRVKSYNTRKGFGFIDGGGVHRDIFVYNNRLVGRIGLIAGEIVEFELIWDEGRPQARAVRVLDPSTNPVLSFDRQTPLEALTDQANVARNPLNAMKQAMMQPSAEERAREMALAAAAAAAEVPTKMPQAKTANLESQLAEKIREAQTAAASDKRQPMPKPEREQTYHPFVDWHAAPSQSHSAAMQPAVPSTGFDSAAKFADEGNIPRGATVRVTNFPATDVNNQTGLVQGYDAATARYAVLVQMQKPNEGGSETVPLQLREEYLIVTQLPAGARGRGRGAAAPGGAGAGVAPLPVNHSSSALKRSAEDALRRFNLVPAPVASGPSTLPAGMRGGNFMPGMPASPGKGGPLGPHPAQRVPVQMSVQNRMPTGVEGPARQPLPGTSPVQPRPGGPCMQQAPKTVPSTGMRLEQYARPAATLGPATPMAPQQSMSGPAMGMPGAAQAPARQPLVQIGQGGAQPPMPKTSTAGPGPRAERKGSAPEGRPGAVWCVLQSKEFQDVIIRETQEVTSPLMDRIKPGETCIQRGETVELLSGLVRMPIEPRGWVTVHARLIGGPTFMEEQHGSATAAAVPSTTSTSGLNAPPPAAVPMSAFSHGPEVSRLHMDPGYGSSVQPQAKAMVAQRLTGTTGPSYKKDQMLKFQQACRRTQQAPREVLRTLRMPGDAGAAPAERKHRGDKERKREQKADHGPESDDRRSPQRERRDEGRPTSSGPLSGPPAARPGPAANHPGASGEEKKADCPTQ